MRIIHAGAAVFDVLNPTVRYADLERVQRRLRQTGMGLEDLSCGIDAEFTALVPQDREEAFRRDLDDLTAGSALVAPLGSEALPLDEQGAPFRPLSGPCPPR